MKRITAFAAAALTLAAASGCGSSGDDSATATSSGSTSSSASKSPYVIGSLTSMTGPFGSSDAGGADGMKAWAAYVNANGGINGHPIKLTVKDDQGNPSVALAAVKAFAADKNVIALVGNISSVEQSWAPVAKQAKLPVVGDFPFTPASFSTTYVFPQATTYKSTLYGEVYAAIKLAKLNKIAFLYCAEEPACALSTQVVKKEAASMGGALVNSQAVPATAPNYDAQCTAAKNAGAEALLVALGASTITSLSQSCASIGYKPQYFFQTTAVVPQMGKVSALNDSAWGVLTTFPWTASSTRAQKAFQEGVKAAGLSADKLNAAVSLGWTGGALFQTAAATVKGDLTRDALANALWSLPAKTTLDGLAPGLTYAKNAPSPEQKCFFVAKLTKGEWSSAGGETKTYCQP